jgi:uncharacterized protein (TIGR00255 family)
MISSMTGFGKGFAQNDKTSFEVELRSVNSRFLEVGLKVSPVLMNREYEIREFIRTKIKRGKVSVNVQLKRNGNSDNSLSIDTEKLKKYHALLKEIKKTTKVKDDITINHLVNFKDIFSTETDEFTEADFEILKTALEAALKELVKMKKNEGEELKKDLVARVNSISSEVERIEGEFKKSVTEYFEKLKERITVLINDLTPYNERLSLELALIADKAEITEECIRLKSHIKFFLESLEKEEEPGRKLNFLCQEMNREANTISSKSISIEIIHSSVQIKEEIEKIREQIQNIE